MSFAGLLTVAMPAIGANNGAESPAATDELTMMNSGARIECITPDGQTGHVSKLPSPDPDAAALIMEDDTVTCLLQEGETAFVVELPQSRLLDRLTFLNENARARGELKIAVSNERLKIDSTNWVEVEGVVPFSHKRLFGVSLIGIEAKFIRLSFRVEKPGRIEAFPKAARDPAETAAASVEDEQTFATPALEELNSKFATPHSRESVLLTANAASVGPLSPSPR
ncbi:MAG TPA: hypothetical protein VGG94_03070 [Chthoniobacterales bacterium]